MDNAPNDPKDLVIMALQQRLGELVSDYELRIASLRANLTLVNKENGELKERAESTETQAGTTSPTGN